MQLAIPADLSGTDRVLFLAPQPYRRIHRLPTACSFCSRHLPLGQESRWRVPFLPQRQRPVLGNAPPLSAPAHEVLVGGGEGKLTTGSEAGGPGPIGYRQSLLSSLLDRTHVVRVGCPERIAPEVRFVAFLEKALRMLPSVPLPSTVFDAALQEISLGYGGFPARIPVAAVSCGAVHTLFLSSVGTVHSCG